MTARRLHVTNGTCTTRLIEAAGIAGECSLWADPLHDGPVPGGLTDEQLLEVRTRHLAPADGGDPVNDLRRWRAAIARHDAYDELVLWFEHDLFDQLNLVQALDWVRGRVPAEKPVSLVCIGGGSGPPAFKGLGELESAEVASLFDARQRVGAAQFELASRAWRAFREPTPLALDDLRRQDAPALPFLARALGRLLQELPWTRDGLSRTERRLLHLAAAGPLDLRVALPRMHEGEHAYYVTDVELANLVAALARTSPPLLRADASVAPAGRAVLTGERDRVDACGIDRWLGGTHLRPGNVWRWDDERQRLTS
jgi:hypothetical protein